MQHHAQLHAQPDTRMTPKTHLHEFHSPLRRWLQVAFYLPHLIQPQEIYRAPETSSLPGAQARSNPALRLKGTCSLPACTPLVLHTPCMLVLWSTEL